jgi:hypothetical protein
MIVAVRNKSFNGIFWWHTVPIIRLGINPWQS